ncbi:hypothetical protein [Sulfitobacter guttiformis]|nr:hypothetical protein [Sulfitobacter guttiformis]
MATSHSVCTFGIPNKAATWSGVSVNTATPLIHACAAKATWLLTNEYEA